MKITKLIIFPLVAAVVGCVTVDSRYLIEVRRPTPEICFVVVQWQTDREESTVWKNRAIHLAQKAIKAELARLNLPRQTIDFEEATIYEPGDWAVVRATTGNMPKSELQAKAKQVLHDIPSGQYLPPPIYVGKGSFTTR